MNAKGGFTLPGESGYEALTLALAERFGADVVRDCDGTALSPEILDAGYRVYSTVCVIREHNAFLRAHPECRQQCILMSQPVTAAGQSVRIDLLRGYSREQFEMLDTPRARAWWQAFDRTSDEEITDFAYENGVVTLKNAVPNHEYTVNFTVYRVWEEISMYNHVTNGWQKEHLMQLEVRRPEARAYLLSWMNEWLIAHPATNVVRMTSLFYNFVWIWGDDARNRDLFSDWGSYDFTVSVDALEAFEQAYGYKITSEDFINKGLLHASHCLFDKKKRDWMDFVSRFVAQLGKELVDMIHAAGKQAYLFYDDSWVGSEPFGKYFPQMGFDGMIKCVFSAFEARLCAAVPAVGTHEIRLHPYLFPVGLGGAPTFAPGGDPARDAYQYWRQVRRGLLRAKIDRIGLGGYLHLTRGFPEFNDAIADIAAQMRTLRALHDACAPQTLDVTVGIVTQWGKLRTWTCSGHYHEHPEVDLINVLESLAGLPVNVRFYETSELVFGVPDDVDAIINAGLEGSAWVGDWQDARLACALTAFANRGGVLLGVNEPTAARGHMRTLRLANVLGVDIDRGGRVCHGRWPVEAQACAWTKNACISAHPQSYLTDKDTRVLLCQNGRVALSVHDFGRGAGVYLGAYRHSAENARLLLRLLTLKTNAQADALVCDNPQIDCALFGRTLCAANASEAPQSGAFAFEGKQIPLSLEGSGMTVMTL